MLGDLAVRSGVSFACMHPAIIVFPWNDKVMRRGCPMFLAPLDSLGLRSLQHESQGTIRVGIHERAWS